MQTLMIAYAVVWAIIFGYLVVQYMRISRLENEIENLKKAIERKS
ncbi:MAG: CcmD family protein [Actinobacteria bacterium]|nr:CcmD family protein [Actinomycetota bacterium]